MTPKKIFSLFALGPVLLTVVFLFPGIPTVYASGNFYVTPSGGGTQNGTDWNNAFAGIPSTLVRGATYYIASGNYTSTVFSQPVSGTTYIYFVKATAANSGNVAGWQSSFGTGQAVWTNPGSDEWDIRTSYLDFDGVTGTGSNNDYGFKLVNPTFSTNNQYIGEVQVWSTGSAPSNVNIRHVQMVGAGQNLTGTQYSVGLWLFGATNWLVQNCFIDNVSTWVAIVYATNITLDHNYFRNGGSNSSTHNAGISGGVSNMIISNNIFENLLGGSNTTYIEPQGNAGSNAITQIPGHWYIYGNVWKATSQSERTTQWANFSVTSNNIIDDVKFYNNTSYGLHGPIGVSGGNLTGSTNINVFNNLWVNTPTSDGLNNVTTSGNNIVSGVTTGYNFGDTPWTTSFVNPAAGDFHLTAHTNAGMSLPSPYNVDPDGNNRGSNGTWDIGAYEYGGTNTGSSGSGGISLQGSGCTNYASVQVTGITNPCPVFSLGAANVSAGGVLSLNFSLNSVNDYFYNTLYVSDCSSGTCQWNKWNQAGSAPIPGASINTTLPSGKATVNFTVPTGYSVGPHFILSWDWQKATNLNNCYVGPGIDPATTDQTKCGTGSWRIQEFGVQ